MFPLSDKNKLIPTLDNKYIYIPYFTHFFRISLS